MDPHRRAMSVGDDTDDRQTESDAVLVAGAIGSESPERLKEPLDRDGWHHWSGIGHPQNSVLLACLGGDL